MNQVLTYKQLYLFSAVYVLIGIISIATEYYYPLVLPFAALMLYFLFTRLDWVMWVILFFTPLSITLTYDDFNLGLSLPSEPLLALVTAIVVFQTFFGSGIDKRVLAHPISLAIGFYLAVLIATTITSQMPLVSIKQVIARLWFIVPYYLVMIFVLKNDIRREVFYWVYLLPLTGVAIYTLYIHSTHGFSKTTSVWVMYPFFKEHTSWGAVLAMYYPVSAYFAFRKGDWGLKTIAWLVFLVMTLAVIFSYTRAAWLSLGAAFGVWLVIKLRIKWYTLSAGALAVMLVSASNWGLIMDRFEKNTTVSSENLGEHISSISNVSTDASNLERINRWASALRMWQERPVMGWGPGTYMFLYAPYQKPWQKTIISTNAGNRGNAHSEYIGPMAESGILGLLSVLLLIGVIIYSGLTLYWAMPSGNNRELVLMAVLGLITYFVHGTLNNFIDMDKASAPVWGFSALIGSYFFANSRE